ncbi:F-BAR and double SH3 domains protein 2 [Nymphon striatum]|nr:F-BAR and double SH3 domains protein 2 [Nymphon striatum]
MSLLKLATTYLNRKVPNIPEAKIPNKKTIYFVWRTTLDETEKLAKAHQASAEVFQQQISDSAKSVKHNKVHAAKKCFECIRKMHDEIHQDYVEMEKVKKVYFEEEHLAHCARDKAYVAEEKLKRKKGKIFQSLTSLQKNSSKFSYKREACDTRATVSRNQYLLWISALNTHLSRYHDLEIPALMKIIDGPFYEKVAEYLEIFSRTELLTCSATQNSYSNIQNLTETISRAKDLEIFLTTHPLVGQNQEYLFEPCDNDEITTISTEYNAGHFLNNECKKWALCYIKDCRIMKQKSKLLQELLGNESESSVSETGSQDKSIDLELKIDEVKDIIRRSEISKAKAWSRLEAMKLAGIDVAQFLQHSDSDSIESQDTSNDEKFRVSSRTDTPVTDSQSEAENRSEVDVASDSDYPTDTQSEMSYKIDPINAAEPIKYDEVKIHEEEKLDVIQQPIFAASRPESMLFPVVYGIVLFPYEALNPDELSIFEQEVVEVIGEGDGDGWVKARNSDGKEGYIPQTYIEIENGGEVARSIHPAPISFSSVNYYVNDEDSALPNGLPPLPLTPHVELKCIQFCRAVYDYEATCDEELTFNEGQIIKLLKTTVNDVDDGWWEGEIDGKIGLFPSLVVENLKISGEPLTPIDFENFTPGIAPPAYTPPKPQVLMLPSQVLVTQPTPQAEISEDKTSEETGEKFSSVNQDFELELNKSQQAQYKSQFSSSDSDGSADALANMAELQSEGSVNTYHPLVSSPDSPHKEEKAENEDESKTQIDFTERVVEEPVQEVVEQVSELAKENGQEDENKLQSIEDEDGDQVSTSGVIITVDTVETPPRSPDEEEPINANVPQDNDSNNESNTNATEPKDTENVPAENEDTEAKTETEKDSEIKPKASSLDDPSRDDNLEQNSPSSDSSKTGDSVVEVFINKTDNLEDNELQTLKHLVELLTKSQIQKVVSELGRRQFHMDNGLVQKRIAKSVTQYENEDSMCDLDG